MGRTVATLSCGCPVSSSSLHIACMPNSSAHALRAACVGHGEDPFKGCHPERCGFVAQKWKGVGVHKRSIQEVYTSQPPSPSRCLLATRVGMGFGSFTQRRSVVIKSAKGTSMHAVTPVKRRSGFLRRAAFFTVDVPHGGWRAVAQRVRDSLTVVFARRKPGGPPCRGPTRR